MCAGPVRSFECRGLLATYCTIVDASSDYQLHAIVGRHGGKFQSPTAHALKCPFAGNRAITGAAFDLKRDASRIHLGTCAVYPLPFQKLRQFRWGHLLGERRKRHRDQKRKAYRMAHIVLPSCAMLWFGSIFHGCRHLSSAVWACRGNWQRPTFDMRGGRQLAKPDLDVPSMEGLDGIFMAERSGEMLAIEDAVVPSLSSAVVFKVADFRIEHLVLCHL